MGTIGTIIAHQDGDAKIEIRAEIPEVCPVCHTAIDVRKIWAYNRSGDLRADAVYQCPRSACRRLFVAHYHAMGGDYFGIAGIAPLDFQPEKFSDIIQSVSPDFVDIYNQSAHSEHIGLTTISGPGYRKALEYLIKDYVISKNPEKTDTVKTMQLANVIANYVDDPRINKTASRATWLGNDETHYYRRWAEQDINDFKALIQLAVRWIESVELTAQYEKEMP